MDERYRFNSFWSLLKGCKVYVQGRKQKVYFYGLISKITYDSLPQLNIEVKDIPDNLGFKGNSKINREFAKIKISEDDEKLLITEVGEPDIYIIKPTDGLKHATENKTSNLNQFKGKDWNSGLKYIVIVRHGSYTDVVQDEPALSVLGRNQIKAVSEEISKIIGDCCPLVFSSVLRRAFESGFLIADSFDAICCRFKCIGEKTGDVYDLERTLELIFNQHGQTKAIIIVSHLPFCERFPNYIADRLYNGIIPQLEFDNGDAVVINLRTQDYQELIIA